MADTGFCSNSGKGVTVETEYCEKNPDPMGNE